MDPILIHKIRNGQMDLNRAEFWINLRLFPGDQVASYFSGSNC